MTNIINRGLTTAKIHNHTTFTMKEIVELQALGTTVSKWRGRDITLLQHPTDADSVVSVGVTFDHTSIIISVESKNEWATALDYAAHNKVYVSE